MVTALIVIILPIGQKSRQPKKSEPPADVTENQSEVVSNKNKTE